LWYSGIKSKKESTSSQEKSYVSTPEKVNPKDKDPQPIEADPEHHFEGNSPQR